jgi:hypothetical protein
MRLNPLRQFERLVHDTLAVALFVHKIVAEVLGALGPTAGSVPEVDVADNVVDIDAYRRSASLVTGRANLPTHPAR